MRRLKYIFLNVITALFLFSISTSAWAGEGTVSKSFGARKAAEKTVAPEFSLPDLSGSEKSLASYKGKTVLLHFWASWCEPCKEEFPAIERLWQRLKGKGLVVVAVAVDSRERVEPLAREFGATFPVLIDQYGAAKRAYRVSVIPSSVIIRANGEIESYMIGQKDYSSKEAVDYFESLVK